MAAGTWSERLAALIRRFDSFNSGPSKATSLPFCIDGRQVGIIRKDIWDQFKQFTDVFILENDGRIALNPSLRSYDERSKAVESMLITLRERNALKSLQGWRNECYEVRSNFNGESLMKVERSAACLLGIKQYGVAVNGYVRDPEQGYCIWIQRRAWNKQTWPGKLDNMVSGGVAVGFGVTETMRKEAQEEASIPTYLLDRITPVGTVTFFHEDDRGLFPETEFAFDIELPIDFVPTNADGEVEDFRLLNAEQLKEAVVSSEFKTTSCPGTLDFMVRHGILTPDNEPNYWLLTERIHTPLNDIYSPKRSELGPTAMVNGYK